ncbi:MAG: VWA domain-containing protein [Acidobacteria bacterium]|nr:MAG: VWA domain-containing protein [Acidobacteriota bacterium]
MSPRRWFLALCASLALAPLAGSGQQAPTFRAGTKVVPLYVTVTDGIGRLVPDLEREDFEIYDNDKAQPLSVFTNEVLPVTVVVMLDTSGSMTANIDLVKAGAEQFFLRLLPRDRAQLGAFNDKIQLVTGLTGDRDELASALRDVDFGYPTRLYDAVATGLDRLEGIEGRRVVLVFTDGDDTSSKISQGKVLERARAEEVMVYAIGLQSDYFDGVRRVRTRPDRGLKKLAEETGGGYFELDKKDQLTTTFTRVSDELHSQYLIGFSPEARDGKVHKLEVRLKQPGMKARARRSYVAE